METESKLKCLVLAQGHTAEMNERREAAERWSDAMSKLRAEWHHEAEDLRAKLATEHDARKQAEKRALDFESHWGFEKNERRHVESRLDTALARVKAWELAYDANGFGPQTPDEVQTFLRERDRVNGQCAELKVSAAERERDTALARATAANLGAAIDAERAVKAETRVKQLENDLEIANRHFRARVAELEAAETALASANERAKELELDLAQSKELCRKLRGAGRLTRG